jgi:glycine/D-amino acid oxidase-like deaminating enzyme
LPFVVEVGNDGARDDAGARVVAFEQVVENVDVVRACGTGEVVRRLQEEVLHVGGATERVGTYTTILTSDFVLDRLCPIVAAGLSGHGFEFTPAIGRILAHLATTGQRRDARFAWADTP